MLSYLVFLLSSTFIGRLLHKHTKKIQETVKINRVLNVLKNYSKTDKIKEKSVEAILEPINIPITPPEPPDPPLSRRRLRHIKLNREEAKRQLIWYGIRYLEECDDKIHDVMCRSLDSFVNIGTKSCRRI